MIHLRLPARFLVSLLFLAACSTSAPPSATLAPDLGKRLVAERAVVTSAHPEASEAGVEMLRRGGNAVDAAVATAFTVSVGEPQMSGVGGGGGMLIWLQDEQRSEYLDFYAAGLPESFRGLSEDDAGRTDLRVVGIPGQVAGLLEAHERWGELPRADVLAPAIRLAEHGFPVNQILAQMIVSDSAKLARYPAAARVFLPEGRPLQPGATLRQPELAATLRLIAERGRSGFYEGTTARAVVRVMNEGGHPVTLADLADYTPQWKRPLCGEYRGRIVLSAPPPQTGSQIIHTLELLEPYDLPALGLPTRSPRAFDVIASALRVGIVDNRHNDDPDWDDVPVAGVISEAYAGDRGRLVGTGRVEEIDAGEPSRFRTARPAPACERFDPYPPGTDVAAARFGGPGAEAGSGEAGEDDGETTHVSVADGDGNAVALTQTNSSLFGSGARVGGFFLNNSSFDFIGGESSRPGRSRWRTRRSTISPTIVLDGGRVKMVVGAPGGGRIPTAVVQNMVYTLDYGLDPLAALRMPRIFPSPSGPRVQIENGFGAELLGQARAMGYEPAALSFGYARLYMIVREGDRWIGVADPRHDGEVRGY